jgi:hypothetical protein
MDTHNWVTALGLFVTYPVLLIATFLVGCAAFGFAWWLRGHIVKERLELLGSQRDDFNNKLQAAEGKLTTLQKQIDQKVSTVDVLATASSTSSLLHEMRIISTDMGTTLTLLSGRFQMAVPPRKIEEQERS